MIRTVKVDKNNYFIDNSTNQVYETFDYRNENISFILSINGRKINVPYKDIYREYGGHLFVLVNDDKYIIDDGYEDNLIKAGYLVYKNYDKEKIENKNDGNNTLWNINEDIRKIIPQVFTKNIFNNVKVDTDNKNITISCESRYFYYTVHFDTIDTIVHKNKIRKDNNLSFYPFNKEMDKFGTMYVSIFCKRKDGVSIQSSNSDKFATADNIIQKLTFRLGNDYHFDTQIVKPNRIVHCFGM